MRGRGIDLRFVSLLTYYSPRNRASTSELLATFLPQCGAEGLELSTPDISWHQKHNSAPLIKKSAGSLSLNQPFFYCIADQFNYVADL